MTTSIEVLDDLPAGGFAASVAPLFEGAPRFLRRLAAARPFGSVDALFERARTIAHAMPEDEQLELIDAHPRLGAPAADVSALSFAEQGYGLGAASAASAAGAAGAADLGTELDGLNTAYEARFGFRYCVFVAGRSRAELLPGMVAALEAERGAEIARALDAIIDIARDRHHRLDGQEGQA